MSLLLIIGLFAAVLGLAYAAFNFTHVRRMEEGTERMQEIASAIRVGANAFIRYEYRVLAVVVVIVALLLTAVVSWQTALCFLLGALMSAMAGMVGMKIATYANVRVSNMARQTGRIEETLRVAFAAAASWAFASARGRCWA